jgi:hypothetical protein
MKALLGVIAVGVLCVPTIASAQVVNLTGQYRCIRLCTDPQSPAFVTQNGSNLRLSTTTGISGHAWVDYPGHIWVESWYEGAVYSPDGMTIQFDRGAVWQRDIGQFRQFGEYEYGPAYGRANVPPTQPPRRSR